MATEIAIFPILPGMNPDDDNTEAGKQKHALLDIIRKQPGFQRLSYGREIENPENLRIYVDWDNIESHKTFMASSDYGPTIETAKTILDMSKVQMYHARIEPHPAPVLSSTSAPVTETITFYFPDEYSQEDRDVVVKSLTEIGEIAAKETKTCRGTAGGWVEEKLAPPGSDEKGSVFVAFIGWDSVDDHLKFRETQAFKDNAHLLRGLKDLRALPVVHIKFEG